MIEQNALDALFEARPATPEMASRGLFDKDSLRASFLNHIRATSRKHYILLHASTQAVHVMIPARDMRGLLPWFAEFPRLKARIRTLTQRNTIETGTLRSVALLDDGQVLGIRTMRLHDADILLYVYDDDGAGNFTARVPSAPMRTVRFDDLAAPFHGHSIGLPTCGFSRQEIIPVAHNIPNIPFEAIDIVYTWVDSEDTAWKARFEEHVSGPKSEGSASKLRYLSRDELKFSLRSVLRNAPWVRNIYIVTDRQVPAWFTKNDRVHIVDHADIFPDTDVLPVFNSHAIESCLHRIDGLAEHFIYFNDDVFLGKPVTPSNFFDADGNPHLFFSGRLSFSPEWIFDGKLPTDAAFRNTTDIIQNQFGFTPCAKVMHTPHPMRRSILSHIETTYTDQIAQTRQAKIRSEIDLNVTGNLSYYHALGFGLASFPRRVEARYFDTGRSNDTWPMLRLMHRPVMFFCLNLTWHYEVSARLQARLMHIVLTYLYPQQSLAERPTLLGRFLKLFPVRKARDNTRR